MLPNSSSGALSTYSSPGAMSTYSSPGAIEKIQNMNTCSTQHQQEFQKIAQGIGRIFGNSANSILETFQKSQQAIMDAYKKLDDLQTKISEKMIEKMSVADTADYDKINVSLEKTLAVFSNNSEKTISNVITQFNGLRDSTVESSYQLVTQAMETKIKLLEEESKQRQILLTQAKAAQEIEKMEAEEKREDVKQKYNMLINTYKSYRENYDEQVKTFLEIMKRGDRGSYQLTTIEPYIDWEKNEVHKGTVNWEATK